LGIQGYPRVKVAPPVGLRCFHPWIVQ
jgi:hypothetical protein